MREVTLEINSTVPQAEFHSLACKYPAFVGGYGSGKSETMCNQSIIDASDSPDALISLYAPTYDLVRLIIAPRLQEKLDEHKILHTYNKANNTIITRGRSNQFGHFILRSLDNPGRIIGYESYRAHIDEIDTLKLEQAKEAWKNIIARNRQKPKGIDKPLNRVCAYTTPEGFNFVYHRWVKNKNPEYELVQASSRSNPFLPEGYIESLVNTYPPELVSAYIDGQFVNLTAGTVYKSFNRYAHNSTETIREKEPLFIGCDFNVTKQAASIYVKRSGGTEWHAVAELVDMYDTPEMIKIITERYKNLGHRIVIYPDATGGSRKTVNASTSDIALLQQAGFEVRARSTNPNVRDRINAMNAAFNKGIVFVNTALCPTITNCLEQQAYDKNGEPDKKGGTDHQNDASSYPIAYEFPIKRPMANIDVIF